MAHMNLEPMRRPVSYAAMLAREDYLAGRTADRAGMRNSPSYRAAWRQEFDDLMSAFQDLTPDNRFDI